MKRTKTKEQKEQGVIKWRKMGGGSFRMGNGRIIKPNQVFSAKLEDIPEAFRSSIVPLNKLPDEPPVVTEPLKDQYKMESTSDGKYNILDKNGKILNEKPLNSNDAQKAMNELTDG